MEGSEKAPEGRSGRLRHSSMNSTADGIEVLYRLLDEMISWRFQRDWNESGERDMENMKCSTFINLYLDICT